MSILASTTVVVVGAGQAGIAASEHLKSHNLSHVVLEKGSAAESWRSKRWDSLVANGPAWHDKFPNMDHPGEQDGFPGKESIADYLVAYSKEIDMPLFTGINVTGVERTHGKFVVSYVHDSTQKPGEIECTYVIAATGGFQIPVSPSLVPDSAVPVQMHSIDYKNPGQIPDDGSVLVVGSGSSGAQIAEELAMAGRKTFLSVGPHDRPPRSYRGRDFCWWLGVLKKWDMESLPNSDHTTIAVSGANGGRTMDFRRLAADGVTLLGRTNKYSDGKLELGSDLVANVQRGDKYYLELLQEADEYLEKTGMELPLEKEAHDLGVDPTCMQQPLRELDLKEHNVKAIIWATGFHNDYTWMAKTSAISPDTGKPVHKRGISEEPGVYFLGLPWQTRRGSSFIWGVWYDAKYVVDHLAKQQMYLNYKPHEVK